ncbi:uncharacterized protein LOC141632804 [Silene latifolia]|uniref:uncharacterized protein LOC141632804 n=1 Tax=Silene latifolia TaxID=37657 RepID=UPI003D76E99E
MEFECWSNKKVIGTIKDRNGVDQQGLDKVGLAFHDYYQHCAADIVEFDNVSSGPTVTDEEKIGLIQPITTDEIKAVVFSMDSNSSPGIDGFSAGFFKSAWSIIASDFCKAVQSFFRTGKMAKLANSTILSLIPKKDTPSSVMDFRPISCCTVFYKTISKILTTRLQQVLPERMFYEFSFPEQFIKWILACITSTLFSLKLNGGLTGFFPGLHANMEKTGIFFGGVSHDIKAEILAKTGFTVGEFPFKYLGFPLGTTRYSLNMFDNLLIKIQKKMQHWSAKTLSYAGKVELINSVIFGIEKYWCSSILLPQAEGERKLQFQSWAHIYAPLKKGGSSIKNVYIWNIALLFLKGLLTARDFLLNNSGSIRVAKGLLEFWGTGGKFQTITVYDHLLKIPDQENWH